MPIVAVGGIGVAVFALLALLLLYGAKLFGQGLASLFPSDVPVLSTIHRALLGAADVAEAAMSWIMADAIRPVINFLLAPAYAFWNFIDSVYLLARMMAGSWVWLLNTAIPQVISKLETYAHRLVVAARSYALALYHDAVAFVHAQVAAVRSFALARYHDAIAFVHAQVAAVRSFALALYHDTVAYANKLYGQSLAYARSIVHVQLGAITAELTQVRNLVTADLGLAQSYADTAVADAVKALTANITTATAAVITYVDVDAIKPLAAAWPGIIDDVTTLEGIIASDLPDIGAAVRAIPRAVPGSLTDALTITGALAVPMLRYMARCGIPNCRNLSSLGRELSELLDALTGGAFLALLIGLCADPIGTAHWLDDNASSLADDAIRDARSLLGV